MGCNISSDILDLDQGGTRSSGRAPRTAFCFHPRFKALGRIFHAQVGGQAGKVGKDTVPGWVWRFQSSLSNDDGGIILEISRKWANDRLPI